MDKESFVYSFVARGTPPRNLTTMDKESFVYSFVARGTVVLAEYTKFTGNFTAIATQWLEKLPSANNKFTYNCDHHTYNFLVEDGYAYCIAAKEHTISKQISIAFLERLKTDFKKRYGNRKADTATAKSLSKDFGPIIKEDMKYIMEHAEEIEKLVKVKDQVKQVQSIMIENIDIAMGRGKILTDLETKTESLKNQAETYQVQATNIKRKMWFQNMKAKLVIVAVLLVLVLIIWLSICRGFDCTK